MVGQPTPTALTLVLTTPLGMETSTLVLITPLGMEIQTLDLVLITPLVRSRPLSREAAIVCCVHMRADATTPFPPRSGRALVYYPFPLPSGRALVHLVSIASFRSGARLASAPADYK